MSARRLLAALVAIASLLLAAPLAQAERVVAFGDSITWGVGTDHPARQSWPARIGARRVAHSGSGLVGPRGDQPAAVTTYRTTVLPLRPDVVIVAYGVNDLHWSTTPAIMAGLRQVKRWNRERGIRTWVATLTPLGDDFPWEIDAQRRVLNDRIREHFGRVIDFDAALADEAGYLPERFDSGDELHPNAAAYRRLAHVAARAIHEAR